MFRPREAPVESGKILRGPRAFYSRIRDILTSVVATVLQDIKGYPESISPRRGFLLGLVESRCFNIGSKAYYHRRQYHYYGRDFMFYTRLDPPPRRT